MGLPAIQWVRERSVGTKLLILILPIVAAFILSLEWYFAWHRDMARVEESVFQQAHTIATQIMADRTYYTNVVVPRIEALGGRMTAQYHRMPEGAPLPATFVREVSEITRAGHGHYTVELLSPWPINKKQGIRDPFQQEGFTYLAQHRDGIFSRIEVVDGQRTLRFLKGDFASAEACITCHNAHPDSPRHDFRPNDLMGGLEVRIPIERWLVKVRRDEAILLLWGTSICLLLVGVIWYGVNRIVTKPLTVLTRLMKKLLATSGDFTPTSRRSVPPGSEPTDEVKSLWKAFAEMEQIIKRQHGELHWANRRLKEQVAERTALLQRTLHAWLKVEPESSLLIRMAPLPIVLVHADGRIAAINGPALHSFGYDEAAVLGKPVTALIAETDWQQALTQLQQAAAGENRADSPTACHVQGLRRGGKRFLLEAALSVIGYNGNRYVLMTIPDLPEARPIT